jgi:hypothetical protein
MSPRGVSGVPLSLRRFRSRRRRVGLAAGPAYLPHTAVRAAQAVMRVTESRAETPNSTAGTTAVRGKSMYRVTSRLTFALALLLAFAPGRDASAQTRNEVVRWQGTDEADTDGYRVHVGSSSGTYTDTFDLGIPVLVGDAFETTITVAAEAEVYIAVSAYNDVGQSLFSNENCKGPDGACAGPVPPPPPPAGVESQIVGFKLWDASSNTVIDSNFTNGEQISVLEYDCVAIEIVGNSYLSDSGPGSIQKSLDGANANGCSIAGVTHENHAPYAWEADSGPGSFECAASLQVEGVHTLTVTPYDDDNCGGAQGTSVTLEFEVTGGSGGEPPPADPTPGQPGRPYIVFD